MTHVQDFIQSEVRRVGLARAAEVEARILNGENDFTVREGGRSFRYTAPSRWRHPFRRLRLWAARRALRPGPTKLWRDPIVLYVLGFLVLTLLEQKGVLPHLLVVALICLGALAMILWVQFVLVQAPGPFARITDLEAELSKLRRLQAEEPGVPVHGEGGIVNQLADALVESFLDQMEDHPPESVEQAWARDLRAALVTACSKVPYFFDPGKRVLMPRRVAIIRMASAAAHDEAIVARCAGGHAMQTCDLVIGIWEDGSTVVGKHFTEGPVEITLSPARTG